MRGRLFWLSEFLSNETPTIESSVPTQKLVKNSPADAAEDDPFGDGMDELFGQDDDGDNEFSISKIKAEVGFDEEGEYVGVQKASQGIKKSILDDEDDDGMSILSGDGAESVHSRPPVVIHAPNPFTEPQKPFQPASSPVSLEHRFMVRRSSKPLFGFI